MTDICKTQRHCGRRAAIHKQGFTLMELLVYMAIVTVVVVIAGEAFSNSTKFRIRTDNMIKATQEAENIASLFKEDVSQLGARASRETGTADLGSSYGSKFEDVDSLIYMDPKNGDPGKRDSSSFKLNTVGGSSDFTFRRVRYHDAVTYNDSGHYKAIEEIHWYVEGESLMRSCKILAKAEGVTIPESDPCHANAKPVVMATGVKIFDVEAARPSVKEKKAQIFPPNNLSEFRLVNRVPEVGYSGVRITNSEGVDNVGGTEQILTGFHSNYKPSDDDAAEGVLPKGMWLINQVVAIRNETTVPGLSWNMLCDSYGKLSFHPDTVYELSFEVSGVEDSDKSLMFVPGEDHMSVGFRKAGSGDFAKRKDSIMVEDFMFFPPLDADKGAGKRSMRFMVPSRVDNVCVAFTFAFFSPLASQGKVTIKNLKIMQVPSSNYKFEPDVERFEPEVGNNKREKKFVKALKLRLQVSRGAKNGGKGETGNVNLIVPIPSNGPRD